MRILSFNFKGKVNGMKKYIYTAVILVGFVLTTSCEDFLTTDNKSNVTDKEYFSTKTGFVSLVSNA